MIQADEEQASLIEGNTSKLQGEYDRLSQELDNLSLLAQYGIVIPAEELDRGQEQGAIGTMEIASKSDRT